MRIVPLGTYLLITVGLAVSVVGLGAGRQMDPPVLVVGTFVWIAIGIVVGAWQLSAPIAAGPFVRNSSYVALYGLIVVAAAFSMVFHLLSPVTADILFKKAQTYDEANRGQQALPGYLDAIAWISYQDYYYVYLGRLFLESAQAAPDKPETQFVSSVNDLARLGRLDQLGRDDLARAALVALTAARDLSPRSTDNTVNLGRLYQTWADITTDPDRKKERYALADSYYQQATDLGPNLSLLYVEWAGVEQAQGRYDQALQKLQRAIQLDDQYPEAWVRLGTVDRALQNLPQAIEHFGKALSLDPASPAAYSGLGIVYYQQGRLTEAADAMLQAARYAPRDVSVHKNLALFYRDLKMTDQAISEAQLALRYASPSQQVELKAFLDELQKTKG